MTTAFTIIFFGAFIFGAFLLCRVAIGAYRQIKLTKQILRLDKMEKNL